jgi:hypothetical protein
MRILLLQTLHDITMQHVSKVSFSSAASSSKKTSAKRKHSAIDVQAHPENEQQPGSSDAANVLFMEMHKKMLDMQQQIDALHALRDTEKTNNRIRTAANNKAFLQSFGRQVKAHIFPAHKYYSYGIQKQEIKALVRDALVESGVVLNPDDDLVCGLLSSPDMRSVFSHCMNNMRHKTAQQIRSSICQAFPKLQEVFLILRIYP